VLLIRHGLTQLTGPVLAGRTPGVHLDERGKAQAAALAERLAGLPLVTLVSSPLERCRETAAPAAKVLGLKVAVDRRLIECGYGDWTGRPLKELAKDPLWKVVQNHPSAVTFPGGEALAQTQRRAVAAVRAWDDRVRAEHGDGAIWAAFSHGDVIKAVIADALGSHLDTFQRIHVDTCSVSAISYTELRPFVLRTNDTGGDLAGLVPAKTGRHTKASSDAPVGGGGGAAGSGAGTRSRGRGH
jgi:probable phosphomutase (TIGR03848 family)